MWAATVSHVQIGGAEPLFHHVHMNVVDPAASVAFYTTMFETTTRDPLAGWDGVLSENLHVLFSKVPRRASTALETAIWHIGWGHDNLPELVEKGRALGVIFERTGPVSLV